MRLRGEISGFRGAHASGHCYFALKDDKAKIEAVIWKMTYGRLKVKPEEGMEVIVQGRVTSYPGSSKYQIVIESLEPAGLGALMALLEERKRKFAAEGLFAEERKTAAAVPAATRRHHHLADRRRHPRHAARLCRALSDARHRLAGARTRRDVRGRGRCRHRRLQCHAAGRPRRPSRCADRRARWRQPGRPLGLQRGDRRACRGGEPHPHHLRRWPRNRLDAHRSRRRRARADADQGGRMGGAEVRRAGREHE